MDSGYFSDREAIEPPDAFASAMAAAPARVSVLPVRAVVLLRLVVRSPEGKTGENPGFGEVPVHYVIARK